MRWIAAALIALAVVVVGWWQIRRALKSLFALARRHSFEDILTIVAACIATGVSAQGMWRFAGDVLALWWPLRVVLFAFIEVAIVTSAVRAKRSMRDSYTAGVDGIAVWALTGLTAVLSSMDARSLPEAVFRLAAPLVAAWLWERGMAIERRRIRGTSGIHWRLTPERILVRLGIAEATDRTAGEVDAQRRLTRVALAAKKAKALREHGAPERKVRAAFAKLDKAMDQAIEHTGLSTDEARQQALLAQIDSLNSTGVLAHRNTIARWADPVTSEQKADALSAIEEAHRFDSAEATQRALDKAALTLMALTEDVTSNVTSERVNSEVNGQVNGSPVPAPRRAEKLTFPVTSDVTPEVTVEQVTPGLNFDVNDPALYDLEQLLSGAPIVTPMLTSTVTGSEVTNPALADASEATKTQIMREYWDQQRARKSYPGPAELARHAGADPSLASRLRKEWVEELSGWEKRRARSGAREKTSA